MKHPLIQTFANTRTLSATAVAALLLGTSALAQPGEQPQRGDQAQAERGDRGDRGHRGDRGDRGPRGDKGTRLGSGERGPRGQKAEKAEKGERGKHGGRGYGQLRVLMKDVDPTDEQKQAIRSLMPKLKQMTDAFHQEHQEAFQALRETMREAMSNQDQDAAQAVRKQVEKLRAGAPTPAAFFVQHADEIGFTREQVAKIKENTKQLNQGPGHHRGPRSLQGDAAKGKGDATKSDGEAAKRKGKRERFGEGNGRNGKRGERGPGPGPDQLDTPANPI